MKFPTIAIAAAFAGAAPAVEPREYTGSVSKTAVEISKFEIQVLGGMTMRAEQVYNENFLQARRGPRAYMQSLRKYSAMGAAIPPDLLQVVQGILESLGLGGYLGGGNGTRPGNGTGNGTGTGHQPGGGKGNATAPSNGTASGANQGEVAAIPQMFDTEYLAAVQIGTPPQTLNLDFDTGSSDMWVFSSETPASEVGGQKLYNPASSSSSQSLEGATWKIQYGDGSGASGVVFLDTVSVGGVVANRQAVEVATTVTGSFTRNAASSGLLGLAMDSVNQVRPQRQKTFFSNAAPSLAMPLFTANLKQGQAGNYNFGFIDQSEYSGNINFVPVNSTRGFWAFEAAGFSVGSNGQAQSYPHTGIADTGTTLMLVDEQVVQAYYAQIPSAQNSTQAGGYVFNCNAELPSFTVDIGGYQAVIPGNIIRFAPEDSDSFQTATTCFGGIQSNTGLPFTIYGDIFLKAQFTVFDAGNMRIGFAPKPAA